jgi:hypothetical protein
LGWICDHIFFCGLRKFFAFFGLEKWDGGSRGKILKMNGLLAKSCGVRS